MARQKNIETESTQEEFLAGLDFDQVKMVAKQLFNVKDPEKFATKEDLIEFIKSERSTVKVDYAKTVELPDGQKLECPVGHAIVRFAPKSGSEWGPKSRETFVLNCHGDFIVGKRGVPVVIREKFLSLVRDAVVFEYTQPPGKAEDGESPKPLLETRIPAEEMQVLFHNPDHAALKAVEEEIKRNSELLMAEKRAVRQTRTLFTDMMGKSIANL